MPSHSELTESIKKILKVSDINTLTAKQVRSKLGEEYGCNMTEYKKFIDDKLMELIEDGEEDVNHENERTENEKKRKLSNKPGTPVKKAKTEEQPSQKELAAKKMFDNKKEIYTDSDEMSSEEEDELAQEKNSRPKTKKQRSSNVNAVLQNSSRSCKRVSTGGSKADVRVSPALAKIVGAERLPRSEVAVRLHQEVIARQLHESSDRMYVICDEDFKAVFGQERLRSSVLMNHAKRHIFKLSKEEINADKPATKRRTGGYLKPVWLSPDLADVLGFNHMPRSSVVKEMWKLIKGRNLQDPKNKKFMLVDDDLKPIFKTSRIQTFGMMKYLVNHISPDDNEFQYYRTYPEYQLDPPEEKNSNGSVTGGS